MRHGGRYSAGVGKHDGTPTGQPTPQLIDDYSGFKVPLDKAERDWRGFYTLSPDKRNPQDYVRGVKDNQNLPFSRPEAPDTFLAFNIIWQDDTRFMTGQDGQTLLTQGETVSL
jgi:hypothetical protein